ncbi:hypothetical protein CYMTET_38980 [Cymbomonas tetramitiformis]|uniref:Uncharacterized protein n=1 Tax=Cymbomonas tetramitiformis TaxID=36881 RepID=A0AAE0F4Q6_9CHLO|nr:hypothetical protein CYMTET_38980 [Cymbomonas tetramitiformis]
MLTSGDLQLFWFDFVVVTVESWVLAALLPAAVEFNFWFTREFSMCCGVFRFGRWAGEKERSNEHKVNVTAEDSGNRV